MPFTHDKVPHNTRIPSVLLGYDTRNAIQGVQISETICCFIGQKAVGVGSADLNKIYDIPTEQQAISLFGEGSNLHLQIRKALETYASSRYRAIAIDDESATAAAGTISITGTATTGGALTISIGGETAEVAISAQTSAETIAINLKNALEKRTLSVSITVTAGVITLTAISKGAGGNTISIGFLQDGASGIITSVENMSGGTDTGIDFEEVFKTLKGEKIDLVSFPYSLANTISRNALTDYIKEVSGPIEQRPVIAISGIIGDLTATDAQLPTTDNPRIVFANAKNSVEPIFQLTASITALIASEPIPSIGHTNQVLPLNAMAGGYLRSEIEYLLRKGVTPLDNEQTGALSVVRIISTETGGISAVYPGLWKRHLDFVRNAVREDVKTSFQKQKLTVTAADRVRSVIFGTLKRLEEAPLEVVKNVDAHASRLIVEPNPDNPGFLICRIPNDIVVPLYGMTGYIDLIIS